MQDTFEAVSVWAGGWQYRAETEQCDDRSKEICERLGRLETLLTSNPAPLARVDSVEPTKQQAADRGEPVLLTDCLEWLQSQRDWAPDTASQYRQLCSDWSVYWFAQGEPEPDIRDLQDGFFAPFAEWRDWSPQNARKHAKNFRTLLRSQMSAGVIRYGRSPGEAVLDYVPSDGLPKKKRERSPEVAFDLKIQTAKLDADDCSALIRASRSRRWPRFQSDLIGPPLVWAGLWSIAWLYGIRQRDLVSLDIRNFDLSEWTLTYLETKGGKIVGPNPVPTWLRPLLLLLIEAAEDDGRTCLFPFSPAMRRHKPSNKAFYRHCEEVYAMAGVEPLLRKHGDGWLKDWIHGWRRSCIVAWKRHAPGYQRFITGHKMVGDISDDHYAAGRVLDDLRDFVETYPCPEAITELNQHLGSS